ncbi:3-hydroxyacyl-CoA dehydrogenase NAD-binding domain-containing protein [Coxiella-like endosymbiont of Rhipicephalus sanguineus]|nr:3-hydroxyacyl-CoA dehydrogenase NAD-binding domain-containing protein [Coxiella-like endosymbiont of Rhipicephalus sanguineus]
MDELTSILKNPELLVAIHFFNPVAKKPPLVEVAKGQKTAPAISEKR